MKKAEENKWNKFRREKIHLGKAIELIDEESKLIKNKNIRLGIIFATTVLQDRLEEIRGGAKTK